MGQKALQVASTGMVGGNLAKAAGLLVPQTERYIALSAAQINGSLATSKLMNAQTVKALGAGVWQGVLEGVAAEAMIQATMAKNPTLDQQDAGDIAWNMMLGGAVSGVVGGAFTAAGIFGKLKQKIGLERIAREPWTNKPPTSSLSSPDEKIVTTAWNMEATAWPWANKMILQNGEVVANNFDVTSQLYNTKMTKGLQDIRLAIHEMVPKDKVMGNMVANAATPHIDNINSGMLKQGYSQAYFQSFAGAKEIGRALEETASEAVVRKAIAAGDTDIIMPSARWVRLHGDNVGSVFDELPPVLSAADYAASPSQLLAQIEKRGFTISGKDAKTWSVLNLKGQHAHIEAEHRYIWARHSLAKGTGLIKEGTVVSEFDFPVLQALFRDDKTEAWRKIKIQRGEGPTLELWTPSSKTELLNLLKENKMEAASRS